MTVPQRPRVTLNMVAAGMGILAGVTAAGRYILTPWFVTVASEALAEDMHSIARSETSPVQSAVKSLLQDKIDDLESRKSVLEATQQRNPAAFTDANAIELASVRARLEKLRAALIDAERQKVGK